jgi:hypothetical protein
MPSVCAHVHSHSHRPFAKGLLRCQAPAMSPTNPLPAVLCCVCLCSPGAATVPNNKPVATLLIPCNTTGEGGLCTDSAD